MGKCAHCGKFILGGKKEGALRFCNEACHQQGFLARLAEQAAPEVVESRLRQIREQQCAVCGGEGPVDIYVSHTAWSLFVVTSWKDHQNLCCARCGRASIYKAMVFTAICGWWGFPFGIVVTPWQLINNAKSLSKNRDSSQPSEELQQMVKLDVASMVKATIAK